MTRRQRAAAPTVPAPVPTLAEAAEHLHARQRTPGILCGYCVRLDEHGVSHPIGRPHRACTWDRCACACRTGDSRNTERTVIVGPAMPNETTQPIPSLLDGIL